MDRCTRLILNIPLTAKVANCLKQRVSMVSVQLTLYWSHWCIVFCAGCCSVVCCKCGVNNGAHAALALFVCVVWPCWLFRPSPVPSISWRRADGSPLPGKIKINHSNGVLEIPYFRPEDAGLYECVAENARGRNVARGQLIFDSMRLLMKIILLITIIIILL